MESKDRKDAEIIEKLVREYFKLEKKKIEDTIPKCIMFRPIKFMKENVRNELSKLYNFEGFDLFSESQEITGKRSNAYEMLFALQKAERAIHDLAF